MFCSASGYCNMWPLSGCVVAILGIQALSRKIGLAVRTKDNFHTSRKVEPTERQPRIWRGSPSNTLLVGASLINVTPFPRPRLVVIGSKAPPLDGWRKYIVSSQQRVTLSTCYSKLRILVHPLTLRGRARSLAPTAWAVLRCSRDYDLHELCSSS